MERSTRQRKSNASNYLAPIPTQNSRGRRSQPARDICVSNSYQANHDLSIRCPMVACICGRVGTFHSIFTTQPRAAPSGCCLCAASGMPSRGVSLSARIRDSHCLLPRPRPWSSWEAESLPRKIWRRNDQMSEPTLDQSWALQVIRIEETRPDVYAHAIEALNPTIRWSRLISKVILSVRISKSFNHI